MSFICMRIECFHSRGQHLCKFIGTKESVCIRKEYNSQRIGLGHQHGRRFIGLGHQYGRRDVMWKHSIKNDFHIKCFAVSLALRQRLGATRRWSIKLLCINKSSIAPQPIMLSLLYLYKICLCNCEWFSLSTSESKPWTLGGKEGFYLMERPRLRRLAVERRVIFWSSWKLMLPGVLLV